MLAVIFIIGGAVISEFSNYLKKKKFKVEIEESKDSYCEIDDSCELSADKSVSK